MKQKKRVYLLFVILLLITIFPLTLSQQEETSAIDKAYACLKNELGDNCGGTRSTKQAAFSLMAAAYDSSKQTSCKSTLNNLKKTNCWAESDSGTCSIKSTALAALSLQYIGENINDQIDYLLNNKKINTGLTWYLEIDTSNKSECDINGKTITIEDNKKISGSPPTGLSRAYNDYWFEINDIEKNYTISCDKDFISTLLYVKPGSNVFHISSDLKSASEFDSIIEKVESFCLTTGGECDYEGTLWASLVLKKEGRDISPLIPYLTSMSDRSENKKYLPSALLYILTNEDEYYSELISLQKSGNFWDESRNKFYDTALALLALQSVNSNEVDGTKKYLLNVQKDNGCWQSDTAFLLHSAWPKNPTLSGSSGTTYCEDFGNYCVPAGECLTTNTLSNFFCSGLTQVCCNSQVQEQTCTEKGGFICNLDQECIGSPVISSDSSFCCVGNCIAIETETECELTGFSCEESCSDTQEEKPGYSSSCNYPDKCCGSKATERGLNKWLIFLLIILIILVILAIIFRNQLKVFIFKKKSGLNTGKSQQPTKPSPGFFPPPLAPRPPPRQLRRRIPPKDREFDETMKKLRDMSK